MAQNFFLLNKYNHKYIHQNGGRKIFVRCSANVLRLNTGGEKHKLASNVKLKPDYVVPYDRFIITQNNFQDWLRVWRMTVSEENPNNKDLFVFARETKEKFTDLVENEIQKLKSVKVSFGLQVEFSIERDGGTQYMEHYFRENEPHVFNRNDEDQIKKEFDRFVERIKGEIESWSERGSGWVLERIMTAYVNVACYQPLRGGTYLPLPANLEKKKAIINVQNRDNECLK